MTVYPAVHSCTSVGTTKPKTHCNASLFMPEPFHTFISWIWGQSMACHIYERFFFFLIHDTSPEVRTLPLWSFFHQNRLRHRSCIHLHTEGQTMFCQNHWLCGQKLSQNLIYFMSLVVLNITEVTEGNTVCRKFSLPKSVSATKCLLIKKTFCKHECTVFCN